MDPITLGGITAGVTGVIVGLFSYLVSRRKNSGEIDTTEASQLWLETGNIRNELRADLRQSKLDNAALMLRVGELEAQVVILQAEIQRLSVLAPQIDLRQGNRRRR